MQTPFEMVKQFHETYGVPVYTIPALPSTDRRNLRMKLLREEHDEFLEGEDNNDLVEIADALADMVYIIYGTALEYGIPLDAVLAEVQRSNLSKLGEDGKPLIRADGKVLKGPEYFKPNIRRVLETGA